MCKYCEGLKINPESFNGEQEALYSDPNLIVQVAQDTPIGRRIGSSTLDLLIGNDLKQVQIFYCPMCGRKLNTVGGNEVLNEKPERRIKTKEEYLSEHENNSLQVMKYFIDKLIDSGKNVEREVKRRMGFDPNSGRLRFVKDIFDASRLDELERVIDECS